MNKPTMLFFVALVSMMLVSCEAGVTSEEKVKNEDIAEYSETAARVDDTVVNAVSPYDFKSMMLRNGNARVQCWRCGSPCSSYMCCNDGYPQCCLYNGRCMCCRI